MNNIKSKIEEFRANLESLINLDRKAKYPSLCHVDVTLEEGPKYFRLVRSEKDDKGQLTHSSVHCFVSKENGDILKAASLKAPVKKNPRGNIFVSLTDGINPYGANYLK